MSKTSGALRIIVVFRSDLPEMTRAKGEVQFGHAVASVLWKAMKVDPDMVSRYMEENQVKVCMEVDDEKCLWEIAEKAEKRGVVYSVVKDAGHTVFACPTVTCVGIGPMSKSDGNNLTRKARMRQ